MKHADGVLTFAEGLKKDAEGVTQVRHADGKLVIAGVLQHKEMLLADVTMC